MRSCKVLSSHYHPYGIALYKLALYQYGGRPVIYGSEDILGIPLMPGEPGYETDREIYKNGLPKEYQYLWMRYQPIPNEHGYVVDWTHEREWRCRIKIYHDGRFGNTPAEGIPLLLPAVYSHERKMFVYYLPKIIVKNKEERELLQIITKELSPEWIKTCQSEYLKSYFQVLLKTNVIALNELENDIEALKLDWAIL